MTMENEHFNILAKELNRPLAKIKNAVELLDEGNTIPFIARYRKELTGEMDEEVLRALESRINYLRALDKRKDEIYNNILEQGKMTEELAQKIAAAKILQEVEDLYLPYKQKKKTRASVAKAKGLEPLAMAILDRENEISPFKLAEGYINDEVEDLTSALSGAEDIIAEIVSDDADLRKIIRSLSYKEGIMQSKAVDSEAVSPYQMYYDYSEAIAKLPPHRILAMNRGESAEMLKITLAVPEEKILTIIDEKYAKGLINDSAEIVLRAAKDGYKRLIAPSIERELRNGLTEKGEEQAIKVFKQNLHSLLLQPPVKGQIVLGVDPGFRTGCKLAVVDETGKVLKVGVMYPHPPQKKYEEAKKIMQSMIEEFQVNIIAIGNGTASRESEALAADVIKDYPQVKYIIVSEAGASVYSASTLAKEEFPEYDLSLRSAVSIARRLQDPLAELVKIEPKAVGVGQYQHDVTPKKLDESLGAVVEDCVNLVGVDLNTASGALLQYIAGLSKSTANGVVKYRDTQGKFINRTELLKVPRLGPKAYEQCAGFIRITDGDNPLDNTSVHPESYAIAEKLLAELGFTTAVLKENNAELHHALENLPLQETAKHLNVGEPTLRDIITALLKPGRDPREELPPPLLRSDVLSIEDLKPEMELMGTVRNVVDFGAFVDIGVKHDGLVHISQLGEKYVKHPLEVVSVGDIVKVKVLSVDEKRGRIALTMKM